MRIKYPNLKKNKILKRINFEAKNFNKRVLEKNNHQNKTLKEYILKQIHNKRSKAI